MSQEPREGCMQGSMLDTEGAAIHIDVIVGFVFLLATFVTVDIPPPFLNFSTCALI